MRRRSLLAAVLAGALVAAPAVAAERATWQYAGEDALVADEAGEVTVTLSLDEPGFPADLPLGYRHFLLDGDGAPQTGGLLEGTPTAR